MRFFKYIGELSIFFLNILCAVFSRPFKINRIIEQIYILGTQSLPLVSVVSFFVGVILALQSAYQLQRLSSEIYIAPLVSLSLCRELGPVLASLIVAGRIGSSVAASIGSMKVTEQIDALRSLGISPIKFLVAPRFTGLVISLPLLIIWADLVGISGGFSVCISKLGINPYTYLKMSFDVLKFKDYFIGIFKGLMFAGCIIVVSSFEGFNTKGGAEGVGKAVIKAVVKSFLLIIFLDCILTFIFFFIL